MRRVVAAVVIVIIVAMLLGTVVGALHSLRIPPSHTARI